MTQDGGMSAGRQIGKDRIGGGDCGLVANPLLDQRQPACRLMDVVPIKDVAEGFEQLFETVRPRARGTAGSRAAALACRRGRSPGKPHPAGAPCCSSRHGLAEGAQWRQLPAACPAQTIRSHAELPADPLFPSAQMLRD